MGTKRRWHSTIASRGLQLSEVCAIRYWSSIRPRQLRIKQEHQMHDLSHQHKVRPMATATRGCTRPLPLSDSAEDVAYYRARADKVLSGVRERWSEQNRPFSMTQAFCVLLSYTACLKSHDQMRLHRASGFPLGFVSLAMFRLSQDADWLSSSGYAGLVEGIEDGVSIEEFDDQVGDLMNAVLNVRSYVELKTEWGRSMGVQIEL